ncbi:heme lyase CcmF/NrfE family subunit [Microaerobacter geothermalis]|uniref:heme lyase CcmF/NrfE family subunit n=1 Tax=Microaerobacter geothermalis TaxID=674972 RepID=UPI001F45D612|nr:heme lyase CcmF/NrfE family subunit [Microaerobacter geothermalis]MCF6095157.1 heme lyase CcmF/NrfE family subunit [Microaerobacter geothermalis]
MLSQIGFVGMYMALAFSVYAFIAFLLGIRMKNERLIHSAKRGTIVVLIIVSLSSLILWYLLGTSDFSVKYVAQYTNIDLPMFYKLTAFWAGNGGSLLLWALTLSIYTVINMYHRKLKDNPLVPYVGAVLVANSIFFLFLLVFVDNPFALNPEAVQDGKGLNPLLQNPGIMLHPVTTYLGYVGFVVPFAFAMAAMFVRDVNNDFWIKITRRWAVIAWLFLTLGNFFGGAWAYQELGWGGIWMWDPVENASFMPWLTGTAFIHSVMIQERKNMLKIWNMVLIIMTYLLSIFGTFLVRSGILTSVHAFSDGTLGTWFLVYLGLATVISLYFLFTRLHLLKQDSGVFESFLSKESSFLVNNLLLVGTFIATFWGTIFPIVSEAVTGTKVTVGPPFYNKVSAPILGALILVMGICPLIAWQKSTWNQLRNNFFVPVALSFSLFLTIYFMGVREFWALLIIPIISFVIITHLIEFIRGTRARKKMTNENVFLAFFRLITRNRRRFGGYIVHLGIMLMALGIMGYSQFQEKVTVTLGFGESVSIGDYKLTYENIAERKEGKNDVVYAELSVIKDGEKNLGIIKPEKVFYSYWPMPTTEIAIYSTFREDLYVVLSGWENDGRATFEVKVIPLVIWIWIGAAVVIIGAVFAVWFGRYGNVTPKYTPKYVVNSDGGSSV